MEIERKFLVPALPEGLEHCEKRELEQAYLCVQPTVRVRKCGSDHYLTVKGRGLLAREEAEFPLDAAAYEKLLAKAEGRRICKTRCLLPFGDMTVELDIFRGELSGLLLAEIEFASVEEARSAAVPAWFGREVTDDPRYQNSSLAMTETFPPFT